MKNVKKCISRTINLAYKHKLISFFIAIGIAISLILFNVLANDDEYANKLVVKELSITSITDGYMDLDSTSGQGKDDSYTNGILRNFDSMRYKVSYKLELKETDPEISQVEGRYLVVDVVLPNTIRAGVRSDNSSGDGFLSPTPLNADYNYYEFTIDNVSTTTTEPASFDIDIDSVNSVNGDASFTPIILVKEKTDTDNVKSISDMSDSEKESFISNIPANRVACNDSALHCETTMTGYYDYDVELYQGVYNSSNNTTTNKNYPVGILIKNPVNVGVYVPNSVSFDLSYTTEDPNLTVSLVENSVVNYKDPSKNYTIYYPDSTGEMINLNNVVNFENNTVTISNLAQSLGHIGTAAFEINSVRSSESQSESSIRIKASNLKVGDTLIKQNGGEVELTDYGYKLVGAFYSTIDIYERQSSIPEDDGNAFLNYNQQFTLEETIAYANNGIGDELDELHNYIKIDSDAFIINKEGNSVSDPLAIMRYGYGEWNTNYFEATGACSNIGPLTKETLMNLYGGPCIREKSTVKWNEEDTNLPLIIVDTVFGDKSDNTLNYAPGTSTITLTGSVRNNSALRNTSHQITTSSVGTFNGRTNYMSSNINLNDVNAASNPKNYSKSVYDFNGRNITKNHSNLCSTVFCAINGETVHIGSFKISNPEVHAYYNDVERTAFYDYPIEWRIDVGTTSDDESIEYTGATIDVAIPKTLDYLYAETIVNNVRVRKNYTSRSELENNPYNIYMFTFTEEEIKDGAINTLSIFTDIYLNTRSNTEASVIAMADISARKLEGTNYVNLRDVRGISYRQNGASAILYNELPITTYGSVSPTNIEKNKPYTYTMKSYNNSSANEGSNGYSYTGATMYYLLPYVEDSNYKIYGKKFTNSKYKVKITDNMAGYKVYYTNAASKNVVGDIYNMANPDTTTTWTEWTNPSVEVEATAIKIVKQTAWDIESYFYSENGVNVVVTPINNAQADAYYNSFLVTVNRPDSYVDVCPSGDDCATPSSRLYYQSSSSLTEVYSRQISGFVFEDYNYSNMFENGEDELENIVVELYKLNNSEYNETSDPSNPNQYVNPSVDELIATKTTSSTGAYSFTGLEPGYYYVLYRYDGDKYTPSEKYAGLLTGVSNANQINSKAVARNDAPNEAVSDILTLSSSSSSNERYINLGLRIRKEFGVEINKYITKVVQTSNQGNKTYEFDKATKVNIDIKNLRNTKFRVTYSFDIVNTKYFPGYIGIIADLMPAGMTFDNTLEGNGDWTLSDGVLYYTGLQNRLLLPGEKQYFSLTLDLDTNKGGTYLNMVAAQMPILMGDDVTSYDFSNITIENNDAAAGGTDDNSGNAAGGTDSGNAAGGTDDNTGYGVSEDDIGGGN